MATFRKDYMHYCIALIIGLVLGFGLQPVNGLTEVGVRVIAILVPTLYLWLTTNTHWTSFLALGMLVMTLAMTPNEVWAGSMGHFVVITIVTYFLLNVCLKETGVINKIAIFFITRKFVQGKPMMFFVMFYAANMIMGLFMDNMSLAIIFIGIAEAICDEIGIKKGEPFFTALFIGSLWCNCTYSITSPIAHALPNILMGLAETQLGVTISYVDWLAVGIPATVVMYIIILLVMRIWNPDATKFKAFDIKQLEEKNPPLDSRGKFAAVVFVIVILMVLLPSFFKDNSSFWAYWNSIGVVVPAILAIAVLSIVKLKDEPVLNVPTAIKQVPWPAVIFAGTVSVFATPLSSEVTGISEWLGNILRPIFGGMSPVLIVILLCLLAVIMTNFLSNTVTMVIFLNIGIVLLTNDMFNMAAFTVIIGFAAGLATVTPSAAVPSPLFFGPGYVTMKNTLKYNMIFMVISFAALIGLGITLIPHHFM